MRKKTANAMLELFAFSIVNRLHFVAPDPAATINSKLASTQPGEDLTAFWPLLVAWRVIGGADPAAVLGEYVVANEETLRAEVLDFLAMCAWQGMSPSSRAELTALISGLNHALARAEAAREHDFQHYKRTGELI